jgi:hypothetical protein
MEIEMYTRKGKIHTLLHFLTKWIDKDRKMIRLSKDRVLEDFFIDDNGVITNKEGEVQDVYLHNRYLHFKGISVHKIQMWTKYGWRDGRKWSIHHIDEYKLNNSIHNLIFLTRSQHVALHAKNRSQETKEKLSKARLGHPSYMKGKKHSEESKRKISEANKGKTYGRIYRPWSDEERKLIGERQIGKKWYNDGVRNYFIFPEKSMPNYLEGMLKRCKK